MKPFKNQTQTQYLSELYLTADFSAVYRPKFLKNDSFNGFGITYTVPKWSATTDDPHILV